MLSPMVLMLSPIVLMLSPYELKTSNVLNNLHSTEPMLDGVIMTTWNLLKTLKYLASEKL